MKSIIFAVVCVFHLLFYAFCQEISESPISRSKAACHKESILKYIESQVWTKQRQININAKNIQDMERIQENHESELTNFKNGFKGLQEIVLQNSERQQNQINNLTNLLDIYNRLQDKLLQKLDRQEQELLIQRTQIDNLTSLMENQTDAINAHLYTGNHSYDGKPNNMIGFNALLNEHGSRPGGLLQFDRIISNYGNDYNTTTGKFTCSTPGMYAFHLTILSKTRATYAWISKKNEEITVAYTSDNNNAAWDSGSCSAMLKLVVGDFVWVNTGGKYYYSSATSFSGALISV